MSGNSVQTFVDDGGRGGLPVVFLHSLAGNTGHWSNQLDHLRVNRRAIAIDLRGHGNSLAPVNNDYSLKSLVDDINEAVNNLDIDRFVLIGHSMGGAVAGAYAGEYPEKVAGILLVDPAGDSTKMPPEQIQQYIDALESDAYNTFIQGYWGQLLAGSRETTHELVMSDMNNMTKTSVVALFNTLFSYDPIPALANFNGPKLSIVTPFNDNPLSLHNLLTDLPKTVVSETGHWIQLDKPDEFNQLMDKFLLSVETRDTM